MDFRCNDSENHLVKYESSKLHKNFKLVVTCNIKENTIYINFSGDFLDNPWIKELLHLYGNMQKCKKVSAEVEIDNLPVLVDVARDLYKQLPLAKALCSKLKQECALQTKLVWNQMCLYIQTNYIVPQHHASLAIEIVEQISDYAQIDVIQSDQKDFRLCLKQPFVQKKQKL